MDFSNKINIRIKIWLEVSPNIIVIFYSKKSES